MSGDVVLYQQDGGIVTVTLNLPERRNPISDPAVVDALVAVCQRMNDDLSVRAAILTGAGSAFSSGGDIKSMMGPDGQNSQSPPQNRAWYIRNIQRVPLAFDQLEVPVIAAVNGPAIGAGCDLTLMCDIRIAARSAKFAESFVKIGLVPGDGGAWLLPRIVGQSRAREMALTGDAIDAEEALACGLVSRVVEDGEVMNAARALAERICVNPPQAVRMTKRLMREANHLTLDNLLQVSAAMQAVAHTTSDHREACLAFLEKRKPLFRGA